MDNFAKDITHHSSLQSFNAAASSDTVCKTAIKRNKQACFMNFYSSILSQSLSLSLVTLAEEHKPFFTLSCFEHEIYSVNKYSICEQG